MPPAKKKVETVNADLHPAGQAAPDAGVDEAAPDSEAPGASEGDDDDAPAEESERLIALSEPCKVHFPEGWPSQELGASANCPCGHAIAFGDMVAVTPERAAELGFDEEQS